MLIPIGKLCTAFNLTPAEAVELIGLLPTPPVIPPAWLLIDPEERAMTEGEPARPFTHGLASEYADRYASRILKNYPQRNRTLTLVLEHLALMTQLLERENSENELEHLKSRWFDEKYDGILSLILGRAKPLAQEINKLLSGSYVFFAQVELEEAILLLHEATYPFVREVKGLTRELYLEVIQTQAAPQTPDQVELETMPESSTAVNPGNKLPPKAVVNLAKAIQAEAISQGLGYIKHGGSERNIRNWLNGQGTPAGFSRDVLMTQEARVLFAKKYIEDKVAEGSSELAANSKKEVPFNPLFHGTEMRTPEDALLMAEAYKDYALAMTGGKEAEMARKSKRKRQ